ncbi:MAG: hypothetical protein RL488_772 [Actinomycetota bacterium]
MGLTFTLVSTLLSALNTISGHIKFTDIARTLSSDWDVTFTPFFVFALFRFLEEQYEPRLLLRVGSSLRIYFNWLYGVALPWTIATASIGLLMPTLFTTSSSPLFTTLTFPIARKNCEVGENCSTESIPTLALLSQKVVLYCLFVVIIGLIILILKSRGWAGEKLFFASLALSQINYALYYLGTFSSVVNIWFYQWWYDPVAGLEFAGFRLFSVTALFLAAIALALIVSLEFSNQIQNISLSLFGAFFWLMQAELVRGSGESIDSFLSFFASSYWATSSGFFKELFLALALACSSRPFAALKGRLRWLGLLALPALALGFGSGGGFWEIDSTGSTSVGLIVGLACVLTLVLLEIRHEIGSKYLALAIVLAGAKYVPGIFVWAPIGVLVALEIRRRMWKPLNRNV